MSKNQGKGILFRSSMNGFNKADVNKYIQDENIRFTALENKYNEMIRELERELDLAKAEIERLSEQSKEAEDLREALDSANSQIKEKQDEISGLTEKVAELEALITEKDLRIEDLETSASENSNASAGMTDEEKNEFGDMLLRAKYASEDMLKRAEEGAGIIIDRAKDEMFTRRYEAVIAAKEIFNVATEELRRSIGICMNDFAAAIRNSKNDPARTSEAADICDDDLGRRIERMQNDLDRAIAAKLAEFDSKR